MSDVLCVKMCYFYVKDVQSCDMLPFGWLCMSRIPFSHNFYFAPINSIVCSNCFKTGKNLFTSIDRH